jgi:diketogulonate reductase-like aldo/keto reductase
VRRTVQSRTGASLPVLGQGTWRMGEDPAEKTAEVTSLRLGHDLGMTLIDTAEMYGDGGSEEVVAEAIEGRRDEVFLVSKVLPWNASRDGTIGAAEASLRRLRTDRIDLYLLHWRGKHPLAETLQAFGELRSAGKILHYGVSNFDHDDLEEVAGVPVGGGLAANQVLYNLGSRSPEARVLPWCTDRGQIVMAYTPLGQNRMCSSAALAAVSARHGATPAQVALAWVIRSPHVVTIPKASRSQHVRENAAANEIQLTADDLRQLGDAFPPPPPGTPLETV